jgi:hypothetical protein
MRRLARRNVTQGLAAVGLGAIAADAAGQARRMVDLELVLALDVSASMDASEYQIQRQGYADAFRDPRLTAAVKSGPNGTIAVTLMQWADLNVYHQSIPWTIIGDEGDALAFAARVANLARIRGDSTSISGAIDSALHLFRSSGVVGRRRVIDVSGDGRNNNGRDPVFARDEAVRLGITINGLAILSEEILLDAYYRDRVIGGTGAFVVAARGWQDFSRAILTKLLTEIVGQPSARLYS